MRSVSLFVAGMLALSAANAADKNVSQQVNADPKGEVDITNVAGSVEVTGWNKSAVDVQGVIGSGVERVDVVSEGSHTIVKVVLPRESDHDGEAKLRIHVPAASEIELNAVSSDFVGAGILGSQRLKSVSGDVRTEIAQADVDVKTVSGDVALNGKGQPANLRVQTVSGDVTVERGGGMLEAVTVSGDLRVRLDLAKTLRFRSTSGQIEFHGKLASDASVDAETISGDVSIEGGSEAGFRYEVSTFSGDIRNCFRVNPPATKKFGPGSTLDGTVGAGSGRLRLKTMSGDVSFCDR